jgi:hypothetical protein
MNERLKELAEQVGATIHKAMHGEAISFLENDLDRFAELVRQDYLKELMVSESTAIAIMQARDRALMTDTNTKTNNSKSEK